MLRAAGNAVQKAGMSSKMTDVPFLPAWGMYALNGHCSSTTTQTKGAYLADRMLHLAPGERMSEDAVAQMLTEAVETSYRKGGEASSILDSVSKETVKERSMDLFSEGQGACR